MGGALAMGGLAASAEIACGAPFYGAPQLAVLRASLHAWTKAV
jgi:hypothetical protein